ncbi:MAG TPA: hypothetical protein VIO61_01110 [Anaerolineaceae bacterium]
MNPNADRRFLILLMMILIGAFLLSLAWFGYLNYQSGMQPGEVGGSSLLLAIPLGLLYFSIGLFILAWRQRRRQGQVSLRLATLIFRTPRIAGILIAIFIGLFSLDVFTGEAPIWQEIGGFIIHSIPSILMVVILVIAWRRPWVGFAAFLLVSILFLRFAFRETIDIGNLLILSFPLAAIALLFWADWKWRPAPGLPPAAQE